MRVHRSMRGGGRGTAGGGEWRGHAGGGGWRLLSALMRGDGSQKNRSSRLAWRSSLPALSVAIECFEALPVRTLVDLSLVTVDTKRRHRRHPCLRFGQGNVDSQEDFQSIFQKRGELQIYKSYAICQTQQVGYPNPKIFVTTWITPSFSFQVLSQSLQHFHDHKPHR